MQQMMPGASVMVSSPVNNVATLVISCRVSGAH
jgi:hypothetical protein